MEDKTNIEERTNIEQNTNIESIMDNPIILNPYIDFDGAMFYREQRKLISEIKRGVDSEEKVTYLTDLTQAAVAVLAGNNDYDTIMYISNNYNIEATKIFSAAKTWPTANFSLKHYWTVGEDSETVKEIKLK